MRLRFHFVLLLVIALGALALAGCSRKSTSTPNLQVVTSTASTIDGTPETITVQDVYKRASQTLERKGQVYHASVSVNNDDGPTSSQGSMEVWANGNRDVLRQKIETDAVHQQTIFAAQGAYTVDNRGNSSGPSPVRVCFGGSIAASSLLGCGSFTEQGTISLEQGSWQGQHAIILVTKAQDVTSAGRTTFTRKLYVDARSYLPIAQVTDGTLRAGGTYQRHDVMIFTGNWIDANTLGVSFFSPVGIGYVGTSATPGATPNATPSAGSDIYWPGQRFQPTNGLPAIAVQAPADATPPAASASPQSGASPSGTPAETATPATPVRPLATFNYVPESQPHGPVIVRLEEYASADWASSAKTAYLSFWSKQPCHQEAQIQVNGGSGTVFLGYDVHEGASQSAAQHCDGRPFTRADVVVTYPQTVVVITAPGFMGKNGWTPSPYGTMAGVESVAQALAEKTPNEPPATPAASPTTPAAPTPTPSPTP